MVMQPVVCGAIKSSIWPFNDMLKIWQCIIGNLPSNMTFSRSGSTWTATWPLLWLFQDLAVRERPPDLLFDLFRIWQCVNGHLTSSLTCSGFGSAWTATWLLLWLVQDLAVRERPPDLLFDLFRIWQYMTGHLTTSLTCSGSGSAWTATWPLLWLVQDLAVRERPPHVSQLPATNRRLSAMPFTVQQYKEKKSFK